MHARELREETGILADPSEFLHLCTIAPDSGVIRGFKIVFCKCLATNHSKDRRAWPRRDCIPLSRRAFETNSIW